MRRHALLAVVLVLLPGCHVADVDHDGTVTIACLGDSNTLFWSERHWCEFVADRVPRVWTWHGRRPTHFRNFGWGGMTVCRHPKDDWPWGMRQLEAARAAHADLVIAAFGTNDLRSLHRSPEEIVDCYRALVEAAAPVPVVVGLTPPTYPPDPDIAAAIVSLNDRLRAAFPASRVLDFHTGFTRDLFEPDGVHLNPAGQARRADIVVGWLRP